MRSLIERHRGRVVGSPGDNLRAEFASVVDAVQSAVEVQKEIKWRNAGLPARRKMEFRIGINLGDVVVEGERIYGDGVNIAARLEGLAEPGGICIFGTVHDQVENKLPLACEFTGESRSRTSRSRSGPTGSGWSPAPAKRARVSRRVRKNAENTGSGIEKNTGNTGDGRWESLRP